MNKVWYASSGKWFKEEEERPFYTPNDCKWAIDIETRWPEIKSEVQSLVNDTGKEFTSNEYVGLTKGNSWSSYTFLFWKIRSRKERLGDKCPKLAKYLQQVPGLVSFSLSRLAAHTKVEPHRGDTNAVMRCHPAIAKIDLGVVERRLVDTGLQIVRHHQPRHPAKEPEHANMSADPVRQRLAPGRFAVCKARRPKYRHEDLCKPHVARCGIRDAELFAGIIDEYLVARPVFLREVHFLCRPLRCPPVFHFPL